MSVSPVGNSLNILIRGIKRGMIIPREKGNTTLVNFSLKKKSTPSRIFMLSLCMNTLAAFDSGTRRMRIVNVMPVEIVGSFYLAPLLNAKGTISEVLWNDGLFIHKKVKKGHKRWLYAKKYLMAASPSNSYAGHVQVEPA